MISTTIGTEHTRIVIVSKTGALSECIVETNKETTLDELTVLLSKKCGHKKHDGFSCYHTYKYKNKSKSKKIGNGASMLYVDVWCKTDGRAGQENKYDLPPPIDEIIIFGDIALVARVDKETACDLSIKTWTKVYEKLFGGFEDLAATAREDENEIDELAFIHASKKTANGYLKDGFVVDDCIGAGSGDSDSDSDGEPQRPGRVSKKKKTITSDTTTESEFVTETETETDSISDSELRSDSSNEGVALDKGKVATKTKTATKTATKTNDADKDKNVTIKGIRKTETRAKVNKNVPVKKRNAKPDDASNAGTTTAVTSTPDTGAFDDKCDSELDEEAYS